MADWGVFKGLPTDLLRGVKVQFRRIKVDVGSTGFYLGHEFRFYVDYGTPTTGDFYLKFEPSVNVQIINTSIELTTGSAVIENIYSGTETTPFTNILEPLRANAMTFTPNYASQVSLSGGGVVGGSPVQSDILRAAAGDQAHKAASVSNGAESARAAPPGTYYYKLTLDAAIGTFRLRWEEFPSE